MDSGWERVKKQGKRVHYYVRIYVWEYAKRENMREWVKRVRMFEKRETESDRERDWDWHVFWWSGVVFHINVWCLCCQVPEMWFRKERREKKGKAEKKRQGRWKIFFFFMWRRWQLPCIALSLNNGMLICITRDVITSTVKRKHNNSSSAPPRDRLGWPTLALQRDALKLGLSQAHTGVHTHAYAHTHTHTHIYTRTAAQSFWSAILFSSWGQSCT